MIDLSQVPLAELRAEVNRRTAAAHPKPKKLAPCAHCGEMLGAAERRKPCPKCGKRQPRAGAALAQEATQRFTDRGTGPTVAHAVNCKCLLCRTEG